MTFKVEKITEKNQQEATSFLLKHVDTAVFLLGNMAEHGPDLGSHVNSGNFKLIRQNVEIVSVFCLTKRGNLLIQSNVVAPVFEKVLAGCKEEPIAIRGLIGDWKFAEEFWQYLKNCWVIKKDHFYSKQINYTLELDDLKIRTHQGVRFLEGDDYSSWKPLRMDYLVEQKLVNDLSVEEMYGQYIEKCKNRMIWGLFVGSELVSIAELNAKTDMLATVGGVYTAPKYRKRGYAKALMEGLIFDCKNKLLLHKLIIFTGENENKPAQKLYESLGCSHAGYIALFFGE